MAHHLFCASVSNPNGFDNLGTSHNPPLSDFFLSKNHVHTVGNMDHHTIPGCQYHKQSAHDLSGLEQTLPQLMACAPLLIDKSHHISNICTHSDLCVHCHSIFFRHTMCNFYMASYLLTMLPSPGHHAHQAIAWCSLSLLGLMCVLHISNTCGWLLFRAP